MSGRPIRERLIEAGLRVARPVLRAVTTAEGKLGRGVERRRGATARLAGWAGEQRERARPLVWVHAPSVGEGLMAKAIIEALREQVSDVQVVFTHFSPSAERILPDIAADVTDYLPWDTSDDIGRAVEALRPDVVACVRTEVWPLLTRATQARGGRVALVNAVLGPDSGRLSRSGRYLLGPLYASLDAVGAVAERDADLYRQMGVPSDRLHVTGDARFDQVVERVRMLRADDFRVEQAKELLRTEDAEFTIVAGSTWLGDEEHLLAVLGRMGRGRWVLVPHEPTTDHLRDLEERLLGLGMASVRLSELEAAPSARPEQVVVVDRVGVLADLYAVADVAYVGGGFRRSGLHSVVEPAALGVPVLFGPRHGNAREAADLLETGAGFEIEDTDALERVVRRLVEEPDARRAAGERARRYVESRLGSDDRNAALIAALLHGPSRGDGSSNQS